MYLTLGTAGWDSAHQRPSHHPNSQCLWRQKAGQGHLKVHQMQHDRTTLTYACLTVEQIDDWWQHTVSRGEVRKHSTRSHPCFLYPSPLFCRCIYNAVFNLRRYRDHLCSDKIADYYSVLWDLQMMCCSLMKCPAWTKAADWTPCAVLSDASQRKNGAHSDEVPLNYPALFSGP